MSKDYGSWSLQDLKSELRRRNARITGKKAVLIQRLEDYDKIFGPLVTDPESCFKIKLPSPDSFRDITSNSEMPMLTEDDLNTFCELTEREDIITSENMYRENFLCSCRVALVDENYYITGQCASEMRKNVTYGVTLKAKDHIILESQCECAAGIGPYAQCKHILVLIYCAINFTKNKKINIRSACTSRLQTFHHPSSSYTGNPIMAKDLSLKFTNKRMSEMTSFDPRPSVEDAEKFQYNFKCLVANYSGEGNGIIPIAQIIKPADNRSLYKDHDYLEKTAEEIYFDSLIKSQEELEELKFNTERKAWLQERKLRLQSSDFKKIISCAPANKHKLAKCLLMSSAELQTPAIKHGRKYESKAIEKFQELTGFKVHKCGIIVHPEHQFLGSTPDGLIENEEILEVKCPYTARHNFISGETLPFIYLCEESGNFKLKETHQYYYQVQGQLFCSQRKWANFFIFTFSDFCLIRVARDEQFIKNMTEQLQSFFNDYYKFALSNRFLYGNHI